MARRAGYTPNTTPSTAATPTASAAEPGEIAVVQLKNRSSPLAASAPRDAQNSARHTQQRRTPERTARPRRLAVPPRAIRTPTSRVRWVTESSSRFMTPTPPTSSETVATPASNASIVPIRALERRRQLLDRELIDVAQVARDAAASCGGRPSAQRLLGLRF